MESKKDQIKSESEQVPLEPYNLDSPDAPNSRRQEFLRFLTFSWLLAGIVEISGIWIAPPQQRSLIVLVGFLTCIGAGISLVLEKLKLQKIAAYFLIIQIDLTFFAVAYGLASGPDPNGVQQTLTRSSFLALMGISSLMAGAILSKEITIGITAGNTILYLFVRLMYLPTLGPRVSIIMLWWLLAGVVWLYERAVQNYEKDLLDLNEKLGIAVKERSSSLQVKVSELNETREDLEEALTELRETQAKIVFTEKIAALGQMASGVAHEINNPVAAIQAVCVNHTENIKEFRQRFPEYMETLRSLSMEDIRKLENLVAEAKKSEKLMFGLEYRERKDKLMKDLASHGVTNPEPLAEKLMDGRLSSFTPTMAYFLKKERGENVLEYCVYAIQNYTAMEEISKLAERAGKIVFALKNFAFFQPEEKKVLLKLKDNLDTAILLCQNDIKKRAEIEMNLDPNLLVLGYPNTLLHVWTNLIQNALQAIESNGKIHISAYRENDAVIVKISDNGYGIPKEIGDKIFEPFFTTKDPGKGTGLGLEVVSRIIQEHDGKLSYGSEPGKTTFTIEIPSPIHSE